MVVFLTWIVLSLTGFFYVKDRLDITWDWLVLGFGIILILNSYVRENSQMIMGVILTVTFGAITLLNTGVLEFPRWQLWSVFFSACGLSLMILWTRKFVRGWILLPGGIFMFAGGAGFATDGWWHYQRTLREIADLWPMMVIFLVAIILIIRNITHEQKHIVEK